MRQLINKDKARALTNSVKIIFLIGLVCVPTVLGFAVYFAGFSIANQSQVTRLTLISANLFSGNGSSVNSRGTAKIDLWINNPGATTSLIEFSLGQGPGSVDNPLPSGSVGEVFQCNNQTSCTILASSPLSAGSLTALNGSSALYFAHSISAGQSYYYYAKFGDGQTLSGALVSQGNQTSLSYSIYTMNDTSTT